MQSVINSQYKLRLLCFVLTQGQDSRLSAAAGLARQRGELLPQRAGPKPVPSQGVLASQANYLPSHLLLLVQVRIKINSKKIKITIRKNKIKALTASGGYWATEEARQDQVLGTR